jgi:hypothetical protein
VSSHPPPRPLLNSFCRRKDVLMGALCHVFPACTKIIYKDHVRSLTSFSSPSRWSVVVLKRSTDTTSRRDQLIRPSNHLRPPRHPPIHIHNPSSSSSTSTAFQNFFSSASQPHSLRFQTSSAQSDSTSTKIPTLSPFTFPTSLLPRE